MILSMVIIFVQTLASTILIILDGRIGLSQPGLIVYDNYIVIMGNIVNNNIMGLYI